MKIVIIGSSAAAVSFAESMRKEENDSEILMIGQEQIMPYYRPMLSHLLLHEEINSRFYLKPEDFYAEKGIEVILGKTVTSIHPENKTIEINEGKVITYDKLILAVGSDNFVPPVNGIEKKGGIQSQILQ